MPEILPRIESVPGFTVAGAAAGMRPDGAPDFALIVSDTDCACAGVFTRNAMKAAPVQFGMDRLQQNASAIRAVAVNTRSANACTGARGLQDARQTTAWVGEALGIAAESVLVMSTGIIGLPLPMAGIRRGVDLTSQQLGHDWELTARAIMTTDTRPKMGSVQVQTAGGGHYTLAGICKGSGMIAPHMATMLAVIVTDAALTTEQANNALQAASAQSFNHIVVDGDMSTNDTAYLLANGRSEASLADEVDFVLFQVALNALTRKLAQDIVRDGEGGNEIRHHPGMRRRKRSRRLARRQQHRPLIPLQNGALWRRRKLGPRDGRRGLFRRSAAAGTRATIRGGRRNAARNAPAPLRRRHAHRLRRSRCRCHHGRRFADLPVGLRLRRRGRSDRLDLRSQPRLRLHQWRLSLMTATISPR